MMLSVAVWLHGVLGSGADRLGSAAAGVVVVAGSFLAGVMGVNAAEGPTGDVRSWVWGGGALATLAMVGRAGKYIGERVDKFQALFNTERELRIRAETKAGMLEDENARLIEEVRRLGDRRRNAIRQPPPSGLK
jgi:hypothetical protein